MKQFLNDRVNDRLKAALGSQTLQSDNSSVSSSAASEHVAAASVDAAASPSDGKDGIETTLEEIEGFHIVRAIACSEAAVSRISQRDNKTYFGVLLDDNNRKPIARLWFNASQKYIGLFDDQKNETRHPIDTLADIYEHAEHIRKTVHFYD